MPELTPDPVFDTLARFTPDASGVDPADILFRAGQASARTRWPWKTAVFGLLLANVVAVGLLTYRDWTAAPLTYGPGPAPEVVTVPVVIPVPAEPVPPPPASSEAPPQWSLGALIGTTDPDQLPKTEPVTGMVPAGPPLTPLAARGGELD